MIVIHLKDILGNFQLWGAYMFWVTIKIILDVLALFTIIEYRILEVGSIFYCVLFEKVRHVYTIFLYILPYSMLSVLMSTWKKQESIWTLQSPVGKFPYHGDHAAQHGCYYTLAGDHGIYKKANWAEHEGQVSISSLLYGFLTTSCPWFMEW